APRNPMPIWRGVFPSPIRQLTLNFLRENRSLNCCGKNDLAMIQHVMVVRAETFGRNLVDSVHHSLRCGFAYLANIITLTVWIVKGYVQINSAIDCTIRPCRHAPSSTACPWRPPLTFHARTNTG